MGCGQLSSIKTEFCLKKKKSSFLFAARCALFGVLVGILQHGISIQNKYSTLTDFCQTSSFLCGQCHTHIRRRRRNELMYTAKTQHPTELSGGYWELLNPGLKASWRDNTRTQLGITLALEPNLTVQLTLDKVLMSDSLSLSSSQPDYYAVTFVVVCSQLLIIPPERQKNSYLVIPSFISISFVPLKLSILVMLHDKDCGDIPSCSEGERGEMTGREAAINNIKHHWRDGQHFGGVSHLASPQVHLLQEASLAETKAAQKKRVGEWGMGGRQKGKKLPETEKCIVSKIGSPF